MAKFKVVAVDRQVVPGKVKPEPVDVGVIMTADIDDKYTLDEVVSKIAAGRARIVKDEPKKAEAAKDDKK